MENIKIVIIDDEIHAIQHLQRLLKDYVPACQVIATFTDARQAIRSSEVFAADILFVDIIMPTMDGLIFSEQLLKRNPHAKIILLTAYRDFNFAKKALSIGVYNYWVKHEIRKNNIENQMQEVFQAVKKSSRIRHSLQQQNFLDALAGQLPFDQLFSPPGKEGVFFLFSLVDTTKESYIKLLSLLNTIPGIRFTDSFFIQYLQVFLCFSPKPFYIQELHFNFQSSLPSDFKGGLVSLPFNQTEYTPSLHENLFSATRNCVFSPRPTLQLGDKSTLAALAHNSDIIHHLEHTFFQPAERAALILNLSTFIQCLENLWSEIYLKKGNRMALEYTQKRLSELMLSMGVVMECSNDLTLVFTHYQQALTPLTQHHIWENNHSFKVKNIQLYIHQHLANDLQLKTLTRKFNISSDYLRKSFKKETGMTITDYITHKRMQASIKLLETKKYKIYEIAEKVGYHSPHYFSQAFYKSMGCYPTDYLC